MRADRPRSTYDLYGRFVPTYHKLANASGVVGVAAPPIVLQMPYTFGSGGTPGDYLRPLPGDLRHGVYVAKNLLSVVVAYHQIDSPPEWIRCVFNGEEWPAVPREAYRLTPELWEVIRDRAFAMIDAREPDPDTAAIAERRLEWLWTIGRQYGAILLGQ